MKWRKIRQIFDFENSEFKKEFVSHSQSPQTVVFDDFIRIYFSTRKKSKNGKFLSNVQFLDFDNSIMSTATSLIFCPAWATISFFKFILSSFLNSSIILSRMIEYVKSYFILSLNNSLNIASNTGITIEFPAIL